MRKLFITLVVDILFITPVISQTTVILYPVKDNTIYSNFPGNSNGSGENFFSGLTNSGSIRRALMKFNIAGSIPACATITSVTLSLYCTRSGPTPGSFNFNLHKLLQDWGEGNTDAGDIRDGDGIPAAMGDVTWPCAFANGSGGCTIPWGTVGGVFNSSASAGAGVSGINITYNWTSAQMATDVQNWLSSPASNFGWILRGQETSPGSAKRFGSREQSNPSFQPGLSITYIITNPAACITLLNLKTFLEGFYTGGSNMISTLYNLGLSTDPTATDSITVNLWSPTNLSDPLPDHSKKVLLHNDGTASLNFPGDVAGSSFYIAVKHRNSIETWSRDPVAFTYITGYDFSRNLLQAFDDGVNPPMKFLATGIYGCYSGDINHDGGIDGGDMNFVDNDSQLGYFGEYKDSDLNGDQGTDGNDMNFVDNNSQLGLFYARPF